MNHYYEKSKGKEDRYIISFNSTTPSALLALVDGIWELMAESVQSINRPDLKYLHYTRLTDTDFSKLLI